MDSYVTLLGLLEQNTGTRWLKHRDLIPPHSRCWKAKVQVPAGLVSPQFSLLGLETAGHFLAISSRGLFLSFPFLYIFFFW